MLHVHAADETLEEEL